MIPVLLIANTKRAKSGEGGRVTRIHNNKSPPLLGPFSRLTHAYGDRLQFVASAKHQVLSERFENLFSTTRINQHAAAFLQLIVREGEREGKFQNERANVRPMSL